MPENSNLSHSYSDLVKTCDLTAAEISKGLTILTEERLTLAKKAIRAEARTYINLENQLISLINELLVKELYLLNETDCKKLTEINMRLIEEWQTFISAANHSLNYLEQYFEHDFWLRLSNKQFSAQLTQLLKKIT